MPRKKNGAKMRERFKKANTNKIISKITHVVDTDKVERRSIRQNMKLKHTAKLINSPIYKKLKFGSINVNGMDTQTDEAVRDIITKRGLDVSYIYMINKKNKTSWGDWYIYFWGMLKLNIATVYVCCKK